MCSRNATSGFGFSGSVLFLSSCRDKEIARDKKSHQSPWCVTWPGPCHHKAPVEAEKYPPPSVPHPQQEKESEVGGQTERESPDRPCECVSYGTDLVLITQPLTPHPTTLCPPSANPHPTSPCPGQYHVFRRNAGLFQL